MLPGQQESVRTNSGTKESLLLLISEANQHFQKDLTILNLLLIMSVWNCFCDVLVCSGHVASTHHSAFIIYYVTIISIWMWHLLKWWRNSQDTPWMPQRFSVLKYTVLWVDHSRFFSFLQTERVASREAEHPSQLMGLVLGEKWQVGWNCPPERLQHLGV